MLLNVSPWHYLVELQYNVTCKRLYCTRTYTRYSRINHMDPCITEIGVTCVCIMNVYMCVELQYNVTCKRLYCTRTYTRYSRINHMDQCITEIGVTCVCIMNVYMFVYCLYTQRDFCLLCSVINPSNACVYNGHVFYTLLL